MTTFGYRARVIAATMAIATSWPLAVPAQRPDGRLTILVSMIGRQIGQETSSVTRDQDISTLDASLDLTDRGSRLQLTASLTFGADFAPRRYKAAGNTYRFVNVDADVDVAAAARAAGRPLFPATGYAPLAARATLIRYWEQLGRPARIGLLPGDGQSAEIRFRGADSVRVGGRLASLKRYTVDGVVWGRETVWLDEAGGFAALITRIHILPLESVREDLAGALPALQTIAVRDQVADLVGMALGLSPIATGRYALVGAKLIDGVAPAPIPNAVVIVQDGRITGAGARPAVRVPAGMRTIDVSGATIIPGLWDMHAHASQIEWAPAYLAAGVTSIRDMGGTTEFLTAMRDAIASGRAAGPRMLLAGLVDGDAPDAMGAVTAATPAQGRAVVDDYKAKGFQQIKLYSRLQPDVVEAIIDRAHERGMTVTGHVPTAVGLTRAVELGMDHVAHMPVRGDPASVQTRETIGFLAAHGTVIDPTAPWNELLGRPTTTTIESFEPGFLLAPPAMQMAYRSVRNAGDAARALTSRRASGALIKALFDAGVPIVAGTDGAVPGVSLLRSIELYVDAGLTPLQAIQSATTIAARAMDVAADVGAITVGSRADLLVLTADPLENIANIRSLKWVIAAGRIYDPVALRRIAGGR